MTTRSRILLALAAVLLTSAYVLPIWKISLEAPQYPEGLGLRIRIDTVEGEKPNDLRNINNLNHYIGMKTIEPDAIPELRLMPWIIGALALLGLAAAAFGKRWMLYVWVGLFILVAVVGLVDFYLWEYDYGHNLDLETASIKIPGMAYQPPLIGSKKLLNFTAHSWPALGGWLIFLSLAVGLALAFFEFRRSRPSHTPHVAGGLALPAILLAALTACAPEPQPIRYGEASCNHCLMRLTDEQFGAELVTPTGKIHVFDAVECLAAFRLEHPDLAVHSLWVTDFADPPRLVSADRARFLRSPELRSPMAVNLAAFAPTEPPAELMDAYGGELLDWPGVLELVRQEWIDTAQTGGGLSTSPSGQPRL